MSFEGHFTQTEHVGYIINSWREGKWQEAEWLYEWKTFMLKPVRLRYMCTDISVACLIIPERQIIMWGLQKWWNLLFILFLHSEGCNGKLHSWSYCVCTYSISSVSMIHLERRVFLRVKIKPCAGHDFNYKGSIYPLDLAIKSLNCHKNHHFWTLTLCAMKVVHTWIRQNQLLCMSVYSVVITEQINSLFPAAFLSIVCFLRGMLCLMGDMFPWVLLFCWLVPSFIDGSILHLGF